MSQRHFTSIIQTKLGQDGAGIASWQVPAPSCQCLVEIMLVIRPLLTGLLGLPIIDFGPFSSLLNSNVERQLQQRPYQREQRIWPHAMATCTLTITHVARQLFAAPLSLVCDKGMVLALTDTWHVLCIELCMHHLMAGSPMCRVHPRPAWEGHAWCGA